MWRHSCGGCTAAGTYISRSLVVCRLLKAPARRYAGPITVEREWDPHGHEVGRDVFEEDCRTALAIVDRMRAECWG